MRLSARKIALVASSAPHTLILVGVAITQLGGCPIEPHNSLVVVVGADQIVSAGHSVTLRGFASAGSNASVTYAWSQWGGPNVALSDSGASQTRFTAPDVEADTRLRFRLTAWSGDERASDTVVVTVVADESEDEEEEEEEEDDEPNAPDGSPGRLFIEGAEIDAFNPREGTLRFRLEGAQFHADPNEVVILINGVAAPSQSVQLSSDEIITDYVFQDGRNDVSLIALDQDELALELDATFWAGSQSLEVKVVDEDGAPFDGAAINVQLVDDRAVMAHGTTVAGSALISNVPGRTVLVTATADDGRIATLAVLGSAGLVQMQLLGFHEPSDVDNNDFALGLEGWIVGDALVRTIAHVEPSAAVVALVGAPAAGDLDLELTTSGEGAQSVSRSFETKQGTRNVTVRYRFITSEVPGGYFGSEFNDAFSVIVRSQAGTSSSVAQNSMNGLGLGAFDGAGATAWQEISVPVNEAGDIVEINVSVTNVADGILDSQIIIDKIEEKTLAITELQLVDIDNTTLKYLSADAHPYFGGYTLLNGRITIEGTEFDSLDVLRLEVIQGGVVKAIGELWPSAEAILLQPFGSDERVSIDVSDVLFRIASAELEKIDTGSDGTVSVRVRAMSALGHTAEKQWDLPLIILARYKETNRIEFSVRDEDRGGDDWVLPSVKTVLEHFKNSITVNDFSNMNAGNFEPDHSSHQTGVDVDGKFTGYEARDDKTAEYMIALLNDPTYGSRIYRVFVTFDRIATDKFWNAIRDVTLNDGRKAKTVIRKAAKHKGHFHWRFLP